VSGGRCCKRDAQKLTDTFVPMPLNIAQARQVHLKICVLRICVSWCSGRSGWLVVIIIKRIDNRRRDVTATPSKAIEASQGCERHQRQAQWPPLLPEATSIVHAS